MKAPSSLISRFAASTAVLAAAIVLLAFFAFQAMRGDIFQDSFESPLDEWSAYIAGRIGEDPSIAQAVSRNHQMGVMLVTSEGVFAFGPDGEPVTEAFLSEHHSSVRTIVVHGHGGSQYSFYLNEGEAGGLSSSLLWSLLGGLLFLLGVVYIVQLQQLRPLRWLQESVEKVSAGDLSTRVPVVRMDEVGQVARAFNHMTERVEGMLNDQDRLMADVSHELRSPLARIKVALEMIPPSNKREQIATDIREMEALTSALLERERIKNRTDRRDVEEFELAAVMRSIVESFDDTGYHAVDTNAVAPHNHRMRLAILVQDIGIGRSRIFRSQLEDISDLDPSLATQSSAARRARHPFLDSNQIGHDVRFEIAAHVHILKMIPDLVGTRHKVGALCNRRIDNNRYVITDANG